MKRLLPDGSLVSVKVQKWSRSLTLEFVLRFIYRFVLRNGWNRTHAMLYCLHLVCLSANENMVAGCAFLVTEFVYARTWFLKRRYAYWYWFSFGVNRYATLVTNRN
jgi:hypothetical protein